MRSTLFTQNNSNNKNDPKHQVNTMSQIQATRTQLLNAWLGDAVDSLTSVQRIKLLTFMDFGPTTDPKESRKYLEAMDWDPRGAADLYWKDHPDKTPFRPKSLLFTNDYDPAEFEYRHDIDQNAWSTMHQVETEMKESLTLSAPNQQSNDITLECGCSISDIRSCPSAGVIKVLLERLDKWKNSPNSDNEPQSNLTKTININKSEIVQSLHFVFDEHDYSITKLLDDFHHLKYEHNIDRDDALFDSAYEFFKESTTEIGGGINDCPFFERHHRDLGKPEDDHKDGDDDHLLMDTVSMIYCYLVYSYDTQRFSPQERQLIMETAGSSSWNDITDTIDGDGIDEVDVAVMSMITGILTEKRKRARGRRRFHDDEDEHKSDDTETVDFAAMSQVVGVGEVVLRKALNQYEKDIQLLIGDLIDVVYGENVEAMPIWNAIEMENEEKNVVFQQALYGHCNCIQLNVPNLVKLCVHIIARKQLQIDIERLTDLMATNAIDGRMFDKGDPEHYQKNGTFSNRFKAVPDCKVQHVRQLYTAVKKWKYVEWKKVAVESKEKEDTVEDDVEEHTKSDQPDVYSIGKRFNFWQRRNDDYVQAKFKDLKEEMLQSPLLSVHFRGIKRWNKLMKTVEAMVHTKAALKITSNGHARYLYRIEKGKPFDSNHLSALKIYTDYTKICAVFCDILRRADNAEIEGIANMARTLSETIQCYGTSLGEETAKKTYYRGVNRTFMFVTIVSRFNLPQSTTSSKLKAVEFAEDGAGGLVLKLSQSKSKGSRKVMKFDCELFSCFPEEQETLFFGGDTELRIKGIMQWAKGKWRHYDKYMEPINALNRMINGRPLRDQSIWNSKKSQKWMNCIFRDHLYQQLSQSDKMDTPEYVSSLLSYQMSSKEHIRLDWNEMKSGHQWMDGVIKSDDNQLDIGNLSVLFSDATSITFVISDGVDVEEEEWESVVEGLSNVHKMGTSMIFRFELSSDESRQNEMNMMADGYLEEQESKWECRRDGNVLKFTISDASKWQHVESAVADLKKLPSTRKISPTTMASVSLVEAVIEIVGEMREDKGSKSNRWIKMEQFGDQIIGFFYQHPELDADDLALMTGKQFRYQLAKHCGNNKVVGATKKLKDLILQKIQQKKYDMESEKQSTFFRQRTESMIAALDAAVRGFD